MVELKQLEKQVITTELKKIFDKYSSSELTTEEKDALKNRKTSLIQCYEYLENFKNQAASNDDMFLDSLMDFIGDILDTDKNELHQILTVYFLLVGSYIADFFNSQGLKNKKKHIKNIKKIFIDSTLNILDTYNLAMINVFGEMVRKDWKPK